MWIFMIVTIIPFMIVFGIISYKAIRMSMNYGKTKQALLDISIKAKDKQENLHVCAYCGAEFYGDTCPSCGAKYSKR